MTVAHDFVPKLSKKARLRFDRHEDQHLLVYPERALVLNESAAAIAEKCDGTRTVDVIVDELVALVGAEEERAAIRADVVAFVTDLREKGLLER